MAQSSNESAQLKLHNYIRMYYNLAPEQSINQSFSLFDLMIKLEEDDELDILK